MNEIERKIILSQHEIFETERLILRKITIDDAADIFEYSSKPEVNRYLTIAPPEKLADTQAGIVNYFIPSRLVTWGLVDKATSKLIGHIELHVNGDQGDFGWVLHPQFWGQGLVPEAAKILRNFAFDELNLAVLVATHDAENPKSGRVMAKIGMKKIGQVWVYVSRDEKSALADYWALTREDYEKEKLK